MNRSYSREILFTLSDRGTMLSVYEKNVIALLSFTKYLLMEI